MLYMGPLTLLLSLPLSPPTVLSLQAVRPAAPAACIPRLSASWPALMLPTAGGLLAAHAPSRLSLSQLLSDSLPLAAALTDKAPVCSQLISRFNDLNTSAGLFERSSECHVRWYQCSLRQRPRPIRCLAVNQLDLAIYSRVHNQ